MKHSVRFLPWAVACVATVQAHAIVINVPADFSSIQQAVNAAGFTDTVLVAPGVYFETVKVLGKSLTLASHFLLDGNTSHILNTVIDASQPTHPDTASAVILDHVNSGVLCGFTLTGGTGTRWFDVSDGLFYREGGGVLTEGGAPTIRDNVIIGNRATNKATTTSAGGGGLRSGFGVGGPVNIVHNVFAYNEGLYGGAAVLFHQPASFRNNIVYRNKGGQDFGGAGVWYASTAGTSEFANNTFVGNHSSLDGGGILVWNAAGNLVNNIVHGNTSTGSGPQIRLRAGAGGTTVSYCDVEGGFAGTGNLNTAPLIDWPLPYLQATSPCIDTGDPAPARNDPEDTGNPGMALPPSLGATHSDMGAAGGPDAAPFPDFNSPQAYLVPDTLRFDTLHVDSTRVLQALLGKVQFGMIQVDSVRFTGDATLSAQNIPELVGPLGAGPVDSFAVQWHPVTYGPLSATLLVYHGDPSAPSPLTAAVRGHAPGKTGDTNFDGVITSADIIHLVNYVFKGGLPPRPVPRSGDVNCSENITSADVIGLVNYVFKGGLAPCP